MLNEEIKRLLKKGEECFVSGDMQKARETFKQILAIDLAQEDALNNLGVIAFFEGAIESAESYFKRVLENDEHYFDALDNMGRCAEARKDYRSAIQWYVRALEVKSDNIVILNCLGNCALQTGDMICAQEVFARSLQLDSTQEEIKALLGNIDELIYRSGQPEKRGQGDDPETLKGINWNAALKQIDVYRLQQRFNDAALIVANYLRDNPDDLRAFKTFAECIFAKKKPKILIVMEQGIGNMVMLTPAIQAINEMCPHGEITILGRYPALQVVEGWQAVGKVIDKFDGGNYDIAFFSIWSSGMHEHYGRVIAQRSLVTARITCGDYGIHEIEHHMKIARVLGYNKPAPAPYCMTHAVKLEFSKEKPIIGLADGSLNLVEWQRKRWPYYNKLAQLFVKNGWTVVLFGGADEAEKYNSVQLPFGVINCMGKYSIPETAVLLKKVDLLVTNDCGPAHIAAALGVPTLILFGPTLPSKNKPVGPNVRIMSKELPCSPCQYTDRWHQCREFRCMTEMTAEEVYQEALEVVNPDDIGNAVHTMIKATDRANIYRDSRKILIVGVFDVPSSTNVFMKKTFEQLGYHVVAYNYRTRIEQLGSPDAMWEDFKMFITDKNYELIIFCKVNGLHPDLITLANSHGRTWYWFMDNINIAKSIRADEYVKRADFASATSEEVTCWFQQFNRNSIQILEGFDPEIYYYPENADAKIYDVVFIGNATDKRIAEIRQLQKFFPIEVFGNGWPDDIQANPPVYNDDLRKIINQARIVLNLVHSNIFSDRIVLTAASGGFVLSQYCPDLEKHFERKKHLDWFSTPDEAIDLITYYLQNPDERKKVARQGMAYVREHFNWKVSCQQIAEIIQQRNQSEPKVTTDVKRVLFVSWHGLGDNVMLTPALRKYKQQYPDRYIAVAGLKRFGDKLKQLLSGLPFINEVISCLPDAWNDFEDYQAGVKAVVAEATKISKEKGFDDVVILPTNRQTGYKLHKIFRFADEVGIQFSCLEDLQTELMVSKEAEKKVETFIKDYPKPILVVHAIAGNHPKTLAPEDVGRIISQYPGYTVFEFGRRSTDHSILIPEDDMEFSKALIKRADMVIAIDSVVMHIAGAFQRPCLTIFTMTPVHQAAPLTYRIGVIGIDNFQTQLSRWPDFMKEIQDKFPRRNNSGFDDTRYFEGSYKDCQGGLLRESEKTSLSSIKRGRAGEKSSFVDLSRYRHLQLQVEDTEPVKMRIEDYGLDAVKFRELILKRLPRPEELPAEIGKATVLDLGCNTAYNTRLLAACYGDAVGVDLNTNLIRHAVDNWSKCYVMDMHYISFKDSIFDLVFAKDVLEHAYDPGQVLAGIFRVLKPGGTLAAFIPIDGSHNGPAIDMCGDYPVHVWKTTYEDCEVRFRGAGFENIQIYRHSHLETVGRPRMLGDALGVIIAKKPFTIGVNTSKKKLYAPKRRLVLPRKYYDPDAYWAAFLTLQCTSRCPYCIQRINSEGFKRALAGFKVLSGEDWLDILNGLDHSEGQRLSVIGGEPTIHPDFIKIINGLENYTITVTTNLNSPFFQDLKRSLNLLKPTCPVRFNTSFHPECIAAEKFCRIIQQLREADLWVDQIAMVDHPASNFKYYQEIFAGYGIRMTAQSFLGYWNGRLYPHPDDRSVKNDPREHGITDLVRYQDGFSAQTRRPMLCRTKRFLIGPDGTVYNCHSRLYSRSKIQCGSLPEGHLELPENFFQCEDYGFCNPCDYPHATFKPIEQAESSIAHGNIQKRENAGTIAGRDLSSFYDANYFGKTEEHTRYVFKPMAQYLKAIFHPQKALDVECGMGFIVKWLKTIGVDAYGCDHSAYAVEHVSDVPYLTPNRIDVRKHIQRESIELLSYLDSSFDLVTCLDVFEHLELEQARQAIRELERVASQYLFMTITVHDEPDKDLILPREAKGDPTHVMVTSKEYWHKLFAKETNLIHRQDLEDIVYNSGLGKILPWTFFIYEKNCCPVCSGVFEGPKVKDLLECNRCGTHRKVFVPPKTLLLIQLKKMILGSFYNAAKESERRQVAELQLQKIEKFTNIGRVFDVGAGSGLFLKVAQEHGWQVDGNEVSKAAITFAQKKYQLSLRYGLLEDLDIEKRYNAFILWHTLEHTINPAETLRYCHDHLSPDGILQVAVPLKPGEQLEKRYESMHLYEFGWNNLLLLIENCGFQVVDAVECSPNQDLQINVIARRIEKEQRKII